jgi:hypothetical protein
MPRAAPVASWRSAACRRPRWAFAQPLRLPAGALARDLLHPAPPIRASLPILLHPEAFLHIVGNGEAAVGGALGHDARGPEGHRQLRPVVVAGRSSVSHVSRSVRCQARCWKSFQSGAAVICTPSFRLGFQIGARRSSSARNSFSSRFPGSLSRVKFALVVAAACWCAGAGGQALRPRPCAWDPRNRRRRYRASGRSGGDNKSTACTHPDGVLSGQ